LVGAAILGWLMKVLLSLACAGLTAAAAPAAAADLIGSAPPPLSMPAGQAPTVFEVGSNWYLRGDLGISFDEAPTLSISSLSTPPPGLPITPYAGWAGTGWSTTNFTGGVGAGYRFNDYLRFDATWDYLTGPGGSRQTTVICPYGLTGKTSKTPPYPQLGYVYDPSNTCSGTTDIKQYNNTFLANAYVDLGTYGGFTPYVGGGLGLNMNIMSGSQNYNETANGQPYAGNLGPAAGATYPQVWVDPSGNPIAPQPNIPFAQQNWNRSIRETTYTFAWALAAGFGFQLNPSTTLDIGYRYLNSGEISKLINPQTGTTIKQNNASQQLRVGIRYVLQ
jgi:opacity protein-like surface antigen